MARTGNDALLSLRQPQQSVGRGRGLVDLPPRSPTCRPGLPAVQTRTTDSRIPADRSGTMRAREADRKSRTGCHGKTHEDGRARFGLQTLKTRAFARFADREGLEDAALCDAVRCARSGLIDADLGGVMKQRIARKGGDRSGGFRTRVLLRRGELAFSVYGFARSDRENLRRIGLDTFRLLPDEYPALNEGAWRAR